MKKLILAINGHPASGRSTFAEILAQMLGRKGIKVTSVHTAVDERRGAAQHWDLEDACDLAALAGFLDAGDTAVVDVAATDTEDILAIFDGNEIDELLGEMDAELTVAIPLPRGLDMTREIVRIGEVFADNADYVIVHNRAGADGDDYDNHWSRSYAQKAMHYLGVIEVELPEIDAAILADLSDSHHLHLAAALTERKSLPRFLRDALHTWELAVAEQLAEADEALVTRDVDRSRSVYASAAQDEITLD